MIISQEIPTPALWNLKSGKCTNSAQMDNDKMNHQNLCGCTGFSLADYPAPRIVVIQRVSPCQASTSLPNLEQKSRSLQPHDLPHGQQHQLTMMSHLTSRVAWLVDSLPAIPPRKSDSPHWKKVIITFPFQWSGHYRNLGQSRLRRMWASWISLHQAKGRFSVTVRRLFHISTWTSITFRMVVHSTISAMWSSSLT